MVMTTLQPVRSGERGDWKRCKKRWYWAWKMGYVPRGKEFGALELGTWAHLALAKWYGEGTHRVGDLSEHLDNAAVIALQVASDEGAQERIIQQGNEIRLLGVEMMQAYQRRYGKDKNTIVLASEIPIEFTIPHPDTGRPMAVHKLKPDLVFMDWPTQAVRLMEHKTAKTISTGHLVIDDQARPYGSMAERPLRRMGIISKGSDFRGITYNFMRKALPDSRPTNAQGKYLNKNGSVSKSQPPPYFVRHEVTMTKAAKTIALRRVQAESQEVVAMTKQLRQYPYLADTLSKTPHKSCERFCPFFAMCVAEEQGADITLMQETLFIRRDPYLYEEEHPTANEHVGFEMG